MSYALLKIIASTSLGKIPTGPDAAFPQWAGPDPAIVRVQAILYCSLSASLLAAFIAMLGKQWLNRFAQVEMSGSIADRSRNRVRKLDGMIIWHFDFVMECLPLLLQIALLLLGYALSNYLFSVNKTIAGVLIGFTTFGLLFYLLIVSVATLSYTCPFQTPLSLILRFMIRFDDEHRRYLRRSKRWLGRIFSFSWKQRHLRSRSPGPHGPGSFTVVNENTADGLIELAAINPAHQSPPLFNKAVWDGHVLDSASIVRLFGISTDADVILAITKFIPEIVWHAGVRTAPLEKLYDTVLECFDRSSGHLMVIPKLRNEAYLGAKALLHLTIQRQCIGDGSDQALFKSISDRHQSVGSGCYEGDSDLESTLIVIDYILLNPQRRISWPGFSPSTTHMAWMSHILLYRAWDANRKSTRLPDDVRQFVFHTLQLDPPPPTPVVTDCLLIIGLVLGITKMRIDDLLVTDKSRFFQNNPELPYHRIYEKLFETFRKSTPTTDEIDRALEALELIAQLSLYEIATESYRLFHVVMKSSVSDAHFQDAKWRAARYAIHGAYKSGEFQPWVEDPNNVLTFLDHHFTSHLRTSQYYYNYNTPIQDALCALAYASDPATIEALKQFDPTKPSFVHGICYVYQDNHTIQLRKAALHFLPLIGGRWFNTPHPIMEPGEMKSFCVDWASAVDSIEHTFEVKKAVLAVLFDMMNSPHWRPHIASDKWNLLKYFTSVPEDSQPLRRCLDNLELMDAISKEENPAVIVHWLEILWLNYDALIPEVREQLETRTKEVAHDQGGRKADLDIYISAIERKLAEAHVTLRQYTKLSAHSAAADFSTKIDGLQQARIFLVALKEGN